MRLLKRVLLWLAGLAIVLVLAVAIGGFFLLRTLVEPDEAAFGNVKDEAATVGLTGAHFKPAAEDYFARMDKGLLLKPAPGAPYPDQINEIATLAKLPRRGAAGGHPRSGRLDRLDRRQ